MTSLCINPIPMQEFIRCDSLSWAELVGGAADATARNHCWRLDAATNARPHMGFGMAKAGCDAQALAEHLRDNEDVDAALKGYNAERQQVGDIVVKHARKLGAHLGVNLATEEDRRMHELLQNDSAMLDWIAVPNFLAAYKWTLTSASGRLLHKPAKQRRKKLK